MKQLEKPYYVERDTLPGLDFNREIVEPGMNKTFPDGAVGVRVDSDFWAVAALPYGEYRDKPIKDIVAEFWPQYLDQASFGADSGTVDQRIEFATEYAKSQDHKIEWLNGRVGELENQLTRLRAGRHDLHERHYTKHRKMSDYFIRQYERLLIATAHEAEPKEAAPGICKVCGLLGSDRVHMKEFIERKAKGINPFDDLLPFHQDRVDRVDE